MSLITYTAACKKEIIYDRIWCFLNINYFFSVHLAVVLMQKLWHSRVNKALYACLSLQLTIFD